MTRISREPDVPEMETVTINAQARLENIDITKLPITSKMSFSVTPNSMFLCKSIYTDMDDTRQIHTCCYS